MNILRASSLGFAAVVVVFLVAVVVGVAFLLNAILPDPSRAKDLAEIILAFITVIAIAAGAYFAHNRFQIFRTFQPHLTISHRVFHRRLSESYIHIDATALLHNSSRVQIELRKGLIRLQGVSPVSDEEAESAYAMTFVDRDYNNLQWPVLERLDRFWDRSELVVEPGESHAEIFEFIIRASAYRSVLVYTYFYNPRCRQNDGSAEGWAATTVYDILEPP